MYCALSKVKGYIAAPFKYIFSSSLCVILQIAKRLEEPTNQELLLHSMLWLPLFILAFPF
jgi:hypothetical protein